MKVSEQTRGANRAYQKSSDVFDFTVTSARMKVWGKGGVVAAATYTINRAHTEPVDDWERVSLHHESIYAVY